MGLFNRFELGFLHGPVAAIGAAVGGAAKGVAGIASTVGGAANAVGGLMGGSSGSSAGSSYAQQAQMAMLANAERQKIADDYFSPLIGKRKIEKGPNKGKVVYGHNRELLMGETAPGVFGRRPKYHAVDFQPMLEADPGLAGTAADVTRGSLANFQQNTRLADAVNSYLTGDAQRRVSAFDPYLMGTLEQTGRNASLAAQGILPTSDVETLVGNRNEMAGIFGTAGTSRGQVAKDLGLARLDLQTRTAPMLAQTNAAIVNAIAPPQMRDDPRTSQVGLQQALGIGAADNQFEAQFDRNELNLRSILQAMPDPQAQGLFNLKNTLRAQQFVVDFGLANGYGVPGTMPDNLGGQGMMGFTQGLNAAGGVARSIGSIFGGQSMASPGLFG